MKVLKLLSDCSKLGAAIGFLAFSLVPNPAAALQPLESFVAGARSQSFDAREQDAVYEQRRWEAQAALGRLLPAFTAQGSLTHNQVKAELPAGTFPGQTDDLTITPQNQFDAVFRLDVPLLDLQAYARHDQAQHFAEAERLQKEATGANLDRTVAQVYFTYLGAVALVDAAQHSAGIAQENLNFVKLQSRGGVATELDLARAQANLERSRGDVADAQLVAVTAQRNLETLSGIVPQTTGDHPADDLRPEAPLAAWLMAKDTPSDQVAQELTRAAAASRRAAHYAFAPTLSAHAQERITNATGFAGQAATYSLQAMLTWRLDYAKYADARAQAASTESAQVRAERIRRNVADSIFEAHHRVHTSIVKSQAARAQAEATDKAAALAQEGYRAGVQTQLDVTQSQRDALQAHAARIKADADLAYARVMLRVAAGLPVTAQGPPTAASTTPSKARSTHEPPQRF